MVAPSDISKADNDVRFVPEGKSNFSSIAHLSRYKWVIGEFDLCEKDILDFGCGSGYGVYMLAREARNVVGIDYSATAIDYAKREFQSDNVTYFCCDATTDDAIAVINRKDFDIVLSFDVIEHIEKYFDYLDNIRQLVSDRGIAIIGCPNRLQTFAWNRCWNPYHFQEFSPYQFEKVLSQYFSSVTLLAQDFKSARTREIVRRTALKTQNKGAFLARKIRKWRKRLYGAQHQKLDLSADAISIMEASDASVLEQAFGLVAICHK